MVRKAVYAHPGGEVSRAEQFVNRMSLKEVEEIQTIVDARRVTLQEEYAASFLPGDRVSFVVQGYDYLGTIMETKNASVKVGVDNAHRAGTIEIFNAVWWLKAEDISRSKTVAPLDTDA